MLALLAQPAIVVGGANLLEDALPWLELRCEPRDDRDIRLRRRALPEYLRVGLVALARLLRGANLTAELGVVRRLAAARKIEPGDAPRVLLGGDVVVAASIDLVIVLCQDGQ